MVGVLFEGKLGGASESFLHVTNSLGRPIHVFTCQGSKMESCCGLINPHCPAPIRSTTLKMTLHGQDNNNIPNHQVVLQENLAKKVILN
jgi:hypothetical protein